MEIVEKLSRIFDTAQEWPLVKLRQKLQELADLRGWSVTQIAEKANVAQSTVHSAMDGHEVGVRKAIALARVMDVPVEWLFNDALDWTHLPRNPFWAPPGLSLGSKSQIRQEFADDLNRYVQRQHGIEAEPPSPKSARPKNTDRPAAATGTSRKRRAAGS